MVPDRLAKWTASVVVLTAAIVATMSTFGLGQSKVRVEPRRVDAALSREREQLGLATKRALRFLRSEQSRVNDEFRGFHRTPYPVAASSLAGLAMLACGALPDEGESADLLVGCLNYLLELARRDAFLTEPGSDANSGSRMHGHCYAVLFLTQIAGSLPRDREAQVSRAVKNGLKVIRTSQSRFGGWYYGAKNSSHEDEASVTICALQALRAAKDAGYLVESACVDRAIRYVKQCQNADGSVRYERGGSRNRTSYTLTAAAVSTLNAAGVYRSEELSRGLEYMKRGLAGYTKNPLDVVANTYFYYGNFYSAQALWQENGSAWDRWYAQARPRLLRKQKANGRWESPFGDVYATSMVLLMLHMPIGYLPIFER